MRAKRARGQDATRSYQPVVPNHPVERTAHSVGSVLTRGFVPVGRRSPEALGRISKVYTAGQLRAHQAVNFVLTETSWRIGHNIVECEQGGQVRADYGAALVSRLARVLTLRQGKGVSRSNVIRCRQFYLAYPNGATLSHYLSKKMGAVWK